jgi:ribose-phosphate pyrophosphokinase
VLNSFEKGSHYDFIKWALTKIDNKNGAQDRIHLVSPDAGAYKKIFDVAKFFKIPNIVTANKVRDVITGQIVKTEVPITVYDAGKTFVIIDDIGDGFGTFIQIAKAIKDSVKDSHVDIGSTKIYLIVTHSIQEKGIINALEYFDMIFTTNSVNNHNIEKLNVYNVF